MVQMKSLFFLAALAKGSSIADKFEEFKAQFGKRYTGADEELRRFKIFTKNVESAAKLQALDGSNGQYGHMSPLADLSEEEYYKMNNLPVTSQLLKEHASKAVTVNLGAMQLPDSIDWRSKGAVTPVKNQAQCGSCWAFATVANMEGQNFLQNGELISLSEQELVDCSTSDNGCNGGLPSRAYEDMISTNSGFELEKAYGYEGKDGSCRAKRDLEKVFIASWLPISTDENQIAAALVKYGPLAMALNAEPMQMYTGGVSDPWFCSPSGIDHAVTLTGFGTDGDKPYWVIKNSWGPEWGEKGYYRLIRGKGKCGMNRYVTTAIAKKSSDLYV